MSIDWSTMSQRIFDLAAVDAAEREMAAFEAQEREFVAQADAETFLESWRIGGRMPPMHLYVYLTSTLVARFTFCFCVVGSGCDRGDEGGGFLARRIVVIVIELQVVVVVDVIGALPLQQGSDASGASGAGTPRRRETISSTPTGSTCPPPSISSRCGPRAVACVAVYRDCRRRRRRYRRTVTSRGYLAPPGGCRGGSVGPIPDDAAPLVWMLPAELAAEEAGAVQPDQDRAVVGGRCL